MRKTTLKLVVCILIFIYILSITHYNYAFSISNIISSGDNFITASSNDTNGFNESVLKDVSNSIYNALFTIGIVVLFIVGIILGIQWMIASVDDKAKIKEMLIPYIVGCVIIFGAFSIWKMVVDFGQDATAESGTATEVTYKCKFCDEVLPSSFVHGSGGTCPGCGKDITDADIKSE